MTLLCSIAYLNTIPNYIPTGYIFENSGLTGMKTSYVYIITNKSRTVFYTGVTADLSKRMFRHRSGNGSKFCASIT